MWNRWDRGEWRCYFVFVVVVFELIGFFFILKFVKNEGVNLFIIKRCRRFKVL